MARSISIQVYRVEVGTDGKTFFVTQSYPEMLSTDDIDTLVPVNLQGGQDLLGLPWLYSKATLRQPGFDQEIFLMNSILDLQNKWGS